MATIRCLEESHFITLSREDYAAALIEIENKKKAAQVNFVKNIPIFSKLTRTFLTRLSHFFKPLNCTKDYFLYREGDPADRVFIVKEGEFVVSKKLITDTSESNNIQDILENP